MQPMIPLLLIITILVSQHKKPSSEDVREGLVDEGPPPMPEPAELARQLEGVIEDLNLPEVSQVRNVHSGGQSANPKEKQGKSRC